MVISDVDESDRGRYTCHATNNMGEAKGNIQVMGNIFDHLYALPHQH